jgi:hypothetical protein
MNRPLVLAVCAAALVVLQPHVPVRADNPYFPPAAADWARIEPARAGWDARALDGALEYAHAMHSSGVVILLDGRILAERNWQVSGPPRYQRMLLGSTKEERRSRTSRPRRKASSRFWRESPKAGVSWI